jgi:hypothetical protein
MAIATDCRRRDGAGKKLDNGRLLQDSAKLSLCERTCLLSTGSGGSGFLSGKSKSLEPLVSSELVREGVLGKIGSCAVIGCTATAMMSRVVGYYLSCRNKIGPKPIRGEDSQYVQSMGSESKENYKGINKCVGPRWQLG